LSLKYTGAIDKQGINIPSLLDGKYNNEWRIYAEVLQTTKQELMPY
jgi:hypothetical protein